LFNQRLTGNFKQELENFIRYEMRGYPPEPQFIRFSGPRNACRDVRTVAKIKGVLDAIPKPPPYYEVEVFDPENSKEVIRKVLLGLRDFFFPPNKGKNKTNTNEKSVFSDAYILPICAGLMVDLLILLTGLMIQLGTTSKKLPEYEIDVLADLFMAFYGLPEKYPDFFKTPLVTRMRPLTVGYAADYISYVIRQVAFNIKNQTYLFYCNEQEGVCQIRSNRAKALINLIHEIITILEKYGYISKPLKATHYEFKGLNLREIIGKFGLTENDFGLDGSFDVFSIKKDLFNMLNSYTNKTGTFRSESGRCYWRRMFGLPCPFDDDVMATVIAREIDARAEYLLRRMKPYKGHWRIILFRSSPLDEILITWLRDDDHGLHSSVREKNWPFWKWPFSPSARVFIIDKATRDKIAKLVKS